jgi:hypothetical protein
MTVFSDLKIHKQSLVVLGVFFQNGFPLMPEGC